MKRWLPASALALLLLYLAAAPYVTAYRLKAAAERHDADVLARLVDFPLLRQNLKDQMAHRVARELGADLDANPLAALGVGLGGLLAEAAVDAYVTPEGVIELMRGRVQYQAADGERPRRERTTPFAHVSMSYAGLNSFQIIVLDDTGPDRRFVLSRQGLHWRLTNIVLPLAAE